MIPEHVTVIVPTRNEAQNIHAFLRSLPAWMSLIVVDASDDVTPDLVRLFRPDRTLLLRHRGHIAEARQFGAEHAQSEWLLFTDADVVFGPDYFRRLRTQPAGDLVYGAKQSVQGYRTYYRWFAHGQQAAHWLGIPAASGSNLLVRRQVLQELGGFDLDLICNEDSELAWRAKRRGYDVRWAPELIVYERDHRRLRRGVLRKTAHSLARCALLYAGLLPKQWRRSDWGYWTHKPQRP